jgi:uncharacterized RDD family membrane protein YckC
MSEKDLNNEIDDLLNDFDFKPITEGLGFHHSLKEKKEVQVSLKSKSVSLKNDIEKRATSLKSSFDSEKADNINMGDLSPFYNKTQTSAEVETQIELSSTDLHEEVIEASMISRTIAWAIDIIMLTSIMLITITGILISSDMPLEIINIFMLSDDLVVSFIALSTMFYIFYFSFLDKTNYSTPGKRMMSLQVISDEGRLTIIQTFTRSVFSIASFGLFNLFKIQDKMTNTKVVISK